MIDNYHSEMYAWAELCRKEQAKNADLLAENAYLRERHAEAVAQLQPTIEVLDEVQRIALWALEGVSMYLLCGASPTIRESTKMYVDKTIEAIKAQAKPHLDHLKTLAKEAEV